MADDLSFEPLAMAGVWLITPAVRADERGHFLRSFCADAFARAGLATDYPQRSVSFNAERHTLRGLHFQRAPHGETKLVRCTRGTVFDVVVDLRRGTPGFGRHVAVTLDEARPQILHIPPGCAHGFMTLADRSEVYYEITPAYVPEASAGVRWDDPALAIPWPAEPARISARDRALPLLAEMGEA
jgi:dTDP-4-dehydrorhamnose 3,5-epimerase